MNPVTEYYINQAGSGLSGFSGLRYQRGNGWFSNIWSKIGLPVLKFLGRQAMNSGLSIASDALDGKSIKDSALNQLKSSGRNTIDYLKTITDQSGSGRKRKRRAPVKASKKRKTIKRTKTTKKRSVAKRKRKRKHSLF